MSTKAESLVTIGAVLAEIFSGICRFLTLVQKVADFALDIIGVSRPFLIKFADIIAKILPFYV